MKSLLKNNTRSLHGFSSLFLDALRLICALTVLFSHCGLVLVPEWMSRLHLYELGHGAVVVFFVLSGFVIAHTTSSRKRTFEDYLASRFSRLYSIYFPAIVFTAMCAIAAFLINPVIYSQYDRGYNLSRYLLSLFFCNELWFISSAPPVNIPLWSLSFEFWYYILFALIYYKAKNIKGVGIAVLVCCLIGPKILVMFPIWGLGWLAYKIRSFNLNISLARFISLIFLIAAVITIMYLPEYPYAVGSKPFYRANAFMSDTITGIFVAACMWVMPTNTEPLLKESASIKKFRFYANLTYPIYLLHFPILVVCSAMLHKYDLHSMSWFCAGLSTTLILCLLLGSYFEKRKGWWYNFFDTLINKKKLSFHPHKYAQSAQVAANRPQLKK